MHHITHTKHHAVLVAIVIGIIAFLILLVWPDVHPVPKASNQSAHIIASAVYQCATGKSIHATYVAGSVQLELSDLRALTLPQAISASGARYADANEDFVFWNKGNTAFIQEHNVLTFTDCVTTNVPQ